MAGMDTPSNGDAALAPGATVGMLQQEPPLDETKTVREQRRGGGRRASRRPGRPVQRGRRADGRPTDIDELLDRDGRAAGEDRPRRRAGTSTAGSSMAMDALRCPPRRCRRDQPVRWRAPPGRAVQAAARAARPAAARRADQPPGRRERAVAGAAPRRSTRAPSSPSPTIGTSSTTSPSGSSSSTAAAPTRTRATTRPTWRRRPSRLKVEGKKDAKLKKGLARELEWVRSNARGPGRPRARRGCRATRRWWPRRRRPASSTSTRSRSRRARGWASLVIEAEQLRKGFDERVLIEDLSFSLPPGGIVGIMGPNGVGKTTLFKMIIGDEKPDDGELRIGETVEDLLRRPEPSRPRPEEDAVGGRLGRHSTTSGSARSR